MPREHARGGFLMTVYALSDRVEFEAPRTNEEPKARWELISSHAVVIPPTVSSERVERELVCLWQKVFYAV